MAGRYPVALRYLSTSQRSANSLSLLSNLLATITCSSSRIWQSGPKSARRQQAGNCAAARNMSHAAVLPQLAQQLPAPSTICAHKTQTAAVWPFDKTCRALVLWVQLLHHVHPQRGRPLHRALLQEQDQPAGRTPTYSAQQSQWRVRRPAQAVSCPLPRQWSSHALANIGHIECCRVGAAAGRQCIGRTRLCGGAASSFTICRISSGVVSASPLRACSKHKCGC